MNDIELKDRDIDCTDNNGLFIFIDHNKEDQLKQQILRNQEIVERLKQILSKMEEIPKNERTESYYSVLYTLQQILEGDKK